MTPLATTSMTTMPSTKTNGVAAPALAAATCGLKYTDTAGPMRAADMITAPPRPTAFLRNDCVGSASYRSISTPFGSHSWSRCRRYVPRQPQGNRGFALLQYNPRGLRTS